MHVLKIDNNEATEISGVKEILSFDDKSVVLVLENQRLVLTGENLKIDSLDVTSGSSLVKGRVTSAKYVKSGIKPSGVLKRLFK